MYGVLWTMSSIDEPIFPTRLKRILFDEGRTQRSLSVQTGIDEGRLSLFVNGILRPGPVNRQKIADALGRTDEADTLFLPEASSDH